MTKITLDFIGATIRIFTGIKEYNTYQSFLITDNQVEQKRPKILEDDIDGETAGLCLWVENIDNSKVLLHEVIHLVTNIMFLYGFNDDELRAYLTEYIYFKVKGE